jgi:hypothetical protein
MKVASVHVSIEISVLPLLAKIDFQCVSLKITICFKVPVGMVKKSSSTLSKVSQILSQQQKISSRLYDAPNA